MPAAASIPDQMDQDARNLLSALNTLTRFHDLANRRRLRHLRLPLSQAHALEALCTDGALSLGALADRIHLDISTASRMIDVLEYKKLIQRTSDPDDARALRLEVTEFGREVYGRIEAEAISQVSLLFSDADPEVRQAAVAIVAWLAGNTRIAGDGETGR